MSSATHREFVVLCALNIALFELFKTLDLCLFTIYFWDRTSWHTYRGPVQIPLSYLMNSERKQNTCFRSPVWFKQPYDVFTQRGGVPHKCIIKLGNGSSPFQHLTIIWPDADLLLFESLVIRFSEIWIKKQNNLIQNKRHFDGLSLLLVPEVI